MKKLQDMTDEELALSYVDGNNRAFDLLLSRNQSKLFSYILSSSTTARQRRISFRRPSLRPSCAYRTAAILSAASSVRG